MKSDSKKIEKTIVEKAKELGASLAGIATVDDLKASPSVERYANAPFYEAYGSDHPNYFEFKGYKWGEEHKSILVWALVHPSIRARTRLVEYEAQGFYPRHECDEVAVERAPDLDG